MNDRRMSTRTAAAAALLTLLLAAAAPPLRAQPAPTWTSAGNAEASLELNTQVTTMGSEPIPVYDGEIKVGAWDLERLSPRGEAPYVHYLARVPLIFEHEEANRRVRKVRIIVEVAGDSHVRALFPEQVRAPAAAAETFVSEDFRFSSQGGPAALRKLDFGVMPQIDGLGTGSKSCTWEFSPTGAAGVPRGDRTVFLILSAPPRDAEIAVTVSAQIDVGREMLGIDYDNSSEISRRSFRLALPAAADPETGAGCAQQLAAARIDGQWTSAFGILLLEQQGETVTGTYSCCQGKLTGRRQGDRLSLTWQDPISGQGWVDFTLAACGEELRGQWGLDVPQGVARKASGIWNAARQPREEVPPGEASFWRIEGTAGTYGTTSGTAVLYQDGDHVRGKIDARFTQTLSGSSQIIPIVNQLEGRWRGDQLELTWSNPLDGSQGWMRLARVAGKPQLAGSWAAHVGSDGGRIVFYPATTAGAKTPAAGEAAAAAAGLAHSSRGRDLVDEAEALRSRRGLFAQAAERYRQAIALLDPERDQDRLGLAWYGLGQSERKLGRLEEADEAFRKALALSEDDSALRLLAQIALQ